MAGPRALSPLHFTMSFAASGILGMVVGEAIDRFGSKPLLILGSIITGIGFFLLSRITELWQLFGVYLFLAVGTSCASPITITTLIGNWFVFETGNGYGIGHERIKPGRDDHGAFYGLSDLRWVSQNGIAHPGGAVLPGHHTDRLIPYEATSGGCGQFPDGQPKAPLFQNSSGRRISITPQVRVWKRVEAMRTATAFWAIVIAFWLAMTGQLAFSCTRYLF